MPRRACSSRAGADVDAVASDGKDPLGLAVYNGNYAVASFRLDAGSRVDHPDAEGFTPLFWAVDRRNMEWNPGFALAPLLRGFAAHPLCHDRRRLAGDESAHALVHLRERGGPGRLGAAAKGARAGRFVRGGGCSGRWGGSRAYPGLKAIDGKFDPESTAEACYRAVCLGRYGMSEHRLRERPAIDHRFIEELVWSPKRQVFELWIGS